jgi:hypothetical protein
MIRARACQTGVKVSTTWRRLGARTGTADIVPTAIRSSSLFLLLSFSVSFPLLYHVEEVGCEDRDCGYSANCHQVYLSFILSLCVFLFFYHVEEVGCEDRDCGYSANVIRSIIGLYLLHCPNR